MARKGSVLQLSIRAKDEEEPQSVLDLGRFSRHHPAFTRGHVLGWVEREHGERAEGAYGRAMERGAVGLSGVLEDLQTVPLSDVAQGRHIGRVAVGVNRHDADGPLGDRGFD